MINLKVLKNSQLTKPLLFLGASLVVFIFISIFGVSKITSQHKALVQAKDENGNLERKLETLETISTSLSGNANLISNALMDTNPTPVVINQLRLLALEHGLIAGSFKSNANFKEEDNQLNTTNIDFTINAGLSAILEYLNAVENLAPITRFEKINIFSETDIKFASITLSAYWADYPTSLPPVDSTASELSQSEEELLTKLVSLRQPSLSKVTPQPSSPRSDPFLRL